MELQQSPLYADYITSLGWTVAPIGKQYIFLKKFPFVGGFMKIQRVTKLPDIRSVQSLIHKYHVKFLSIEPDASVSSKEIQTWMHSLPKNVRVSTDYYLPTKTVRVPLILSVDQIFQS